MYKIKCEKGKRRRQLFESYGEKEVDKELDTTRWRKQAVNVWAEGQKKKSSLYKRGQQKRKMGTLGGASNAGEGDLEGRQSLGEKLEDE